VPFYLSLLLLLALPSTLTITDLDLPWLHQAPVRAIRVVWREHGLASYYHHSLRGKLMANHQHYDAKAMTCAHRWLKFGTWVRIRRTDTGRSILAQVSDRGPFVTGRVVDLSAEAARRLCIRHRGVTAVTVEVL